ncbi:manganese/zinc/iron transport system permease protein [Actinoalloteichus hoggarensis]|uniref:Manganese transport system membrane protein MntB n=1 Tax=Actinoalloteichus hoggarensis TaxID=1470176 RepID=A0A221W213_9PSEU|nr:metal ABC transporter permease [Actinoalloteichus hoggarensis]ASO19767.1 Manganese transport system membrane protein MntB [Actinoalloteichus hoggarensis]MBB5919526.1 manganese/zinc/iron transport system permease protein [Actinoalloteichus hoggarensis]
MSADDVVIVLTAGLLGTACALLGCFLVLRGQALLSDAMSHAALPGIVLVYLVTGGRAPLTMILGAAAFGVVCVLGYTALRRSGLLGSDAAIALVFPALFSLGVVGVSGYASGAHLDLDAAVYGEITFAPLRTVAVLGVDVPRSLLITGLAAVSVLVVILLLWRPLQTATFDPDFARVAGLGPRIVDRTVLVATALVAVTAFESVGAILVVTFFIVPAATGGLLAVRLDGMLAIAVASAWIAAVVGQRLAVSLNASIAGTVGLSAVGLFVLALLFGGRRGLLRVSRRAAGAARSRPGRPLGPVDRG